MVLEGCRPVRCLESNDNFIFLHLVVFMFDFFVLLIIFDKLNFSCLCDMQLQ